jgi:hypothetical protein
MHCNLDMWRTAVNYFFAGLHAQGHKGARMQPRVTTNSSNLTLRNNGSKTLRLRCNPNAKIVAVILHEKKLSFQLVPVDLGKGVDSACPSWPFITSGRRGNGPILHRVWWRLKFDVCPTDQ